MQSCRRLGCGGGWEWRDKWSRHDDAGHLAMKGECVGGNVGGRAGKGRR